MGGDLSASARQARASLEAVCRQKGLAMTVQRRIILQALAGRRDHPTADGVYEGVRDRIPGISRTTVYRVLEAFVRIGVLAKVSHPGAAVRFDPITERHHHLVCAACDRVEDLDRDVTVSVPKIGGDGFKISDYSIYFRGLCRACRKKKERTESSFAGRSER